MTASRGASTVEVGLAAHRIVEVAVLLGSMGESDGVTATTGAPTAAGAGGTKERGTTHIR